MQERTNQLLETQRRTGIRSAALTLAVFLVVVSISVFIGTRYYETEKEVLQLQGELNAKESAKEYDRCLITRVNIITMVGYMVDEMMASGADNREIGQFITEKTTQIIATLDPDTTGLYGLFNGEYLDGAGWVPDGDFVPTERLWYTETLKSGRKITFIEPYLDAQTGTVMMTVSRLLRDGKSVIAMDVSLNTIQEIVKSIAAATEGSQAMVLDETGIVVAHSDETQLGLNYLEDAEGPGSAAARKILTENRTKFDLETAEGNYSVYVDGLEGGWYSVSLINADIWYRPLRRTMITSVVTLALIVVFLAAVFLHLNRKDRALQTLHTRIDQEEKRGEELQLLSETDRMTGLYDHVSGQRKVDEILAEASGGMFLEMDIDHFKEINDTCGHQTGDRVILAVSDAMRGAFRANDILMRLGGDEFGVFAAGITDRGMGESIIGRFFTRLEQLEIPELQGEKIHVSAGAVLWDGKEPTSFDRLYAGADSAMYLSKKNAGNSLTFGA